MMGGLCETLSPECFAGRQRARHKAEATRGSKNGSGRNNLSGSPRECFRRTASAHLADDEQCFCECSSFWRMPQFL